jgi:hypothetical protein
MSQEREKALPRIKQPMIGGASRAILPNWRAAGHLYRRLIITEPIYISELNCELNMNVADDM